jgi:hypothetical protein
MYGELSFDEEEQVHQHLESCAPCRSEFDKVKHAYRCFNTASLEPSQELIQNCRRNLRVTVAALHDAGLVKKRGPFDAIRSWWAPAIWKPAAALGLLAVGFFGGQLVPRQGIEALPGGSSEPAVSRVRYVRPDDAGNVRLVVEDVRQRVLTGSVDDSQIRHLLLTAAREANDPGIRVETMGLLKSQSDSAEVKRALLASLQSDSNPGVRLKALEALRGSADETETRRVLAQVLLTDDNPGVRTQAIDLLTQRRERAMVGVLQELMEREENNYVRLKCQKALNEMNASVETF